MPKFSPQGWWGSGFLDRLGLLPRPCRPAAPRHAGNVGFNVALIIIISMILRRNLPRRPAGAASQGLSSSWLRLLLHLSSLWWRSSPRRRQQRTTIPRLIPAIMFAFWRRLVGRLYGDPQANPWCDRGRLLCLHHRERRPCRLVGTVARPWCRALVLVVLPGLALVLDAKRTAANGGL